MAAFGEFRPILGEIARSLRIIANATCSSFSALSPIAGTSDDDPITVAAGYTNLIVTKTNGTGTVDITFPDGSIYVLSADGEEFSISGNPKLGAFEIALDSGATYKYFAY